MIINGSHIVPWGDEDSYLQIIMENNVDILIVGHTHEQKILNLNEKYVINPGSLTGSYGPYSTYLLILLELAILVSFLWN